MRIIVIVTLLCIGIVNPACAQQIVNLVLVGNKGVTEDIKEANAFIAIRLNANGSFERLDYGMQAPLQRLRTYRDSTLKILHGPWLEYDAAGNLVMEADYRENARAGTWNYLNDTGKVVREEVYENGVLVKTIDPDTVKANHADSDSFEAKLKDGRFREAMMAGGDPAFKEYLMKNLNGDVATLSKKGGVVKVLFIIQTSGEVSDVHLRKSVEFVLDEEALRVIRSSPKWIPALENKQPIKAYRLQPITFSVVEE